jgi:repressor LexA
MELTDRNKRILEFVRSFDERNGYPPSIREIASAVGLKSTKSVKDHLDWLVARGYLRRSERAARAISVRGAPLGAAGGRGLPVVGQVAAGKPILAQENITGWIELPGYPAENHFFLRVKGDSMTGDGILDGDLVLVRSQPFVRQDETAVVLVGDEATVKHFHRVSPDVIELVPANPAFQVMTFSPGGEPLKVLGKVVAVLRTLEDPPEILST